LHSLALSLVDTYREEGGNSNIQFVHGNILNEDWSSGDFIFINSTCFDNSLMGRISSKAEALKKGAILVTLTKRLPSPNFRILEAKLYQMSWVSLSTFNISSGFKLLVAVRGAPLSLCITKIRARMRWL
jgi:hypothetical protein